MTEKQSRSTLPPSQVRNERGQFAAQIRAGRAVLGWSQTDLGEKTGVTQRAIYRVEVGATQPRQLTRLRIEKAFGPDMDHLLRMQLAYGAKTREVGRDIDVKRYVQPEIVQGREARPGARADERVRPTVGIAPSPRPCVTI